MTIESRREFIHALGKAMGADDKGGQQLVANALGIKNRQGIDNQIRIGFGHKWKPLLLELAAEHGIGPHPELLQGREKRINRYTTEQGQFIRDLKVRYGGMEPLAKAVGCSESTLRRMCERRSYMSPRKAVELKKLAMDVDIPIPDWLERISLTKNKDDAI